MYKNLIKIKDSLIKKDTGNNKKNIENLAIFLVLLIITIIAINTILKGEKKKSENIDGNSTKHVVQENINSIDQAKSNDISTAGTELEKNLEAILSKLNGVGKISVMVTYSETSEVVSMYNESVKSSITEETDTNGGKRTIEQKDSDKNVAYQEESGTKTPVTQKVILPRVVGAVVIAEGAKNALVKSNILQAVEAVTGLPTHKIQVFEMK